MPSQVLEPDGRRGQVPDERTGETAITSGLEFSCHHATRLSQIRAASGLQAWRTEGFPDSPIRLARSANARVFAVDGRILRALQRTRVLPMLPGTPGRGSHDSVWHWTP